CLAIALSQLSTNRSVRCVGYEVDGIVLAVPLYLEVLLCFVHGLREVTKFEIVVAIDSVCLESHCLAIYKDFRRCSVGGNDLLPTRIKSSVSSHDIGVEIPRLCAVLIKIPSSKLIARLRRIRRFSHLSVSLDSRSLYSRTTVGIEADCVVHCAFLKDCYQSHI